MTIESPTLITLVNLNRVLLDTLHFKFLGLESMIQRRIRQP